MIVLPGFDPNRGIAATGSADECTCIGIARQSRSQVIDGEVDGLWKADALIRYDIVSIDFTAFAVEPSDKLSVLWGKLKAQ